MRNTAALLLFLTLCTSFSMEKEKYLQVPALPGDGVFSMLRRYHLDEYSCNHQRFYKLNNLDKEDGLKVGRYYYLPIILYNFNGKTIRSSIGIDDWNLAKSIEGYNEGMLADGYQLESFKESKELWVPYHFLHCPKPDIQTKEEEPEEPAEAEPTGATNVINLATAPAENRRFPIFGKEYEYVPLQSTKLRGKVFYVVTGHGGPDPGAMGSRSGHTLCEDEYAYDVGLRLVRNLVAHGATAYMIVRDPDDGIRSGQLLDCDNDELVWGNKAIYRQQSARLHQRSGAINKLYEKHRRQGIKEQTTIIIHVDSRSKKTQTDLFFYYHPNSTSSKKVALQMQRYFKKKYEAHRASGKYFGTVTPRDLHMLRETKPPSVYIELGNIRNSFDQQRIILESNRQALANWIFESLAR
jgi:N-acetylmuramoyl-L-alanine amidase